MPKPALLSRRPMFRTLLLGIAAFATLASPSFASSIASADGKGMEGPGIVAPAEPGRGARDPQSCAEAFHARFESIRNGPLAALAAAAGTEPGPADAALPGMLLFPPEGRAPGADNASALRAAAELARRQGRTAQALDADTRWIVSRIREDLGDFLGQKTSPYLCSGTAEYLDTLRAQAARVGSAPDRVAAQVEAQRAAAKASLAAARAALATPPVPTFAPAEGHVTELMSQTLRRSVGLDEAEVYGPVMRTAGRQDTRISEGSSDPDLPPLEAFEALQTGEDVARAIRDLTTRAEKAGAFADPAMAGTDPMRTGSIAATGPLRPEPRPALPLLAELKPRMSGMTGHPLLRTDLARALSDLEALDYLLAAKAQPADPLPAALEATFSAIAKARAEACDCRP